MADSEDEQIGKEPWFSSFLLGGRSIPPVPAFTLFCTSIGFGALAKASGFSFIAMFFMSGLIFALPAQVVFADELARGASLLAIASAVTLTGVRLLPMTVSLLPSLRDPAATAKNRVSAQVFLAAHYVAVTSWLEHKRLLPIAGHRANRIPFFIGLGFTLSVVTTIGSTIGFFVSTSVGAWGAAVLLFMTPLYFFISLLASARLPMDWLAIGSGVVLSPFLFLLIPSFALVLTGVIGGTVAFLVGRKLKGEAS